MLFLLNARVLDLGAPGETLQQLAGDEALRRLSAVKAMAEARTAVFQAGGVERLKDETAMTIACTLTITTEANAAVFVIPAGARGPQDVASRLARVGLTTLAWFDELQKDGKVTPALVNANVWAQVAA